jgi:hypothetical protein
MMALSGRLSGAEFGRWVSVTDQYRGDRRGRIHMLND